MTRYWIVTLLIGLVLAAGCGRSTATPEQMVARRVADHATPVDLDAADLTPAAAAMLSRVAGDARLVGLGESRHDTHEQIVVKTQLFRHLVTSLDFRVLILEESYPHARALDRHVTTGEGDLANIMNGLAGWYLWDVAEMADLMRWIRQQNAESTPAAMIRIVGMDITAPAPAVREALRFVHEHGRLQDLDEADFRLDLHAGDFWPATWSAYSRLTDQQREALVQHHAALVAACESLAEADDNGTMGLLARLGQAGNRLFCAEDRAAGGAIREQGMLDVVRHVLQGDYPSARCVMWTHNLHAARQPFRMPAFGETPNTPLGCLLHDLLGADYVAVGTTFGTGHFPADQPPGARDFPRPAPGTMDGLLTMAIEGAALVDLQRLASDATAARWLSTERAWRAQDADCFLVPRDAFDLLFHVPTVTRARLTTAALARHRGGN